MGGLLRRAALALWVVLLAACQTHGPRHRAHGEKKAEPETEEQSGSGPATREAESGAAAEPEGLPPAREPQLVGSVTPAPWLKGALRVAAVRRGDKMLVAAAGIGWLRLYTPGGKPVDEARKEGGAQLLEILDVDGKPGEEILVGRGVVRGALDSPASLLVYRAGDLGDRPESIPLPETTRPQVVGVAPASDRPGDLFVASYESKYQVALLRARRAGDGTWTTEPVGRARVVGAIASVPAGGGARDLVVARVYGDRKGEPGDVTVFAGDQRIRIPSTRGARALVALPGERPAVVFSDGWHRDYGRRARALITLARPAGGTWQSETLARVAKRYGYHRLRIGDIDGDRHPEAIAAGNGPPVAVSLEAPAGAATLWALGEEEAEDAFAADLDGDGADEVILTGPAPGIWRRR